MIKNENDFNKFLDLISFRCMREENWRGGDEQLQLFIARKQLEKIQIKISNRIEEILQRVSNILKSEQIDSEVLMEYNYLKDLNKMLTSLTASKPLNYINTIDACNIKLNGEKNCDIIVGMATEEELQTYAYNLLKQYEEQYGPIEMAPKKTK